SWANHLKNVGNFLKASGIDYGALRELLDSSFMAPFLQEGQPPLQPELGYDVCDVDHLQFATLVGSVEDVWAALHRFLRLQRRLGWAIREVDKVLTTFGGSIDDAVIERLGDLEVLQRRFGRVPLVEMASWWADLDTRDTPSRDESSFYTRLFLNKSISNPAPSAFELPL